MRIEAGTKMGGRVKVTDLAGNVLPAKACDTEQGWIDLFLIRPPLKDGSVKIFRDGKKRELAKVRLHTDYNVIDRLDNKILYRVRWAWSGEPRVLKQK